MNKLRLLKLILERSERVGECLRCFHPLSSGYSYLEIDGKSHGVHRLIMHLMLDFDLESELLILHNDKICKYKNCIEFNHLKIGTHTENRIDTIEKYKQTTRNREQNEYCFKGHRKVYSKIQKKLYCIICMKERARKAESKRR